MKILMTGNPTYGAAMGVNQIIPGCDFVSRSNGFDLSIKENQKKLAEKSLDYDVFISNACLWGSLHMDYTIEVIKKWQEKMHDGHIIVFGSGADTPVRATTWEYPAFKKGLRAYCRQISSMISSPDSKSWVPFRMTYFSPGNIATPKQLQKYPNLDMIDVNDIGRTIKWIIETPKHLNISEVCMDQIHGHQLDKKE